GRAAGANGGAFASVVRNDFGSGTNRRRDLDGDDFNHRTLPGALAGFDRAEFEFAFNVEPDQRGHAMNYIDLFILLVPEIIVVLTAFVVLIVDMAEMRPRPIRTRMRVAAIIASVGCVVAIYWLSQ